ncbi:universal stress protein [Pseudonocardia sulfidoxydans NBRC 16205]|uniref:Universal stress protein n=1 Tax=Pseudonocardia sulfidoxydans NBRC 16205 TaxID=1223511 RepID=A0A511DGJ0_9PSEU|nr:universal stress protein [Pseudonocardia sulfidoxydans]GEL23637.1 universal stress protein [Pseudonocardia sulfidoxydans NBRC 16205]
MTPSDTGARVVVGLDDTATALHAVAWAAAEASARGCALSIVHATPRLAEPAPGRGHDLLDLGRAAAAASDPQLAVSTLQVDDGPATALLDAAEDAVLLVAGLASTTLADSMLGSIGLDQLGPASCPVAVVRPPDTVGGAVVVAGAEPGCDNSTVLAAAFAAAAAHHGPLTVAYVLARGTSSTPDDLHDCIRLWSVPYPSVDVDVRSVAGEPADVLAQVSEGARMLVVGGPSGRGGERPLFGSTTRSLAWNSRCPVLVARATAGAGGPARLVGTTAAAGDPPARG